MFKQLIDFFKTPTVKTSDFQKQIKKDYKKYFVKDENKVVNKCLFSEGIRKLDLMPNQKFTRDYFKNNKDSIKGMLLFESVGCHSKDTLIMLSDGSLKKVQDIQVGDQLMGDDSTPRNVLELKYGNGQMYKINPVRGESFIVNDEHILCLRTTKLGITTRKNKNSIRYIGKYVDSEKIKKISKGFKTEEEAKEWTDEHYEKHQIIELSVKDYLKLPKYLKKELRVYKNKVNYPEQDLPIDPYIFGLWLGDGSKRGPIITNQDSTVLYYLKEKVKEYGCYLQYQSGYDYRINSLTKKNPFITFLKTYNVKNNKHIPDIYKYNSTENRLKLLSGILDSDGSMTDNVFDLCQKRKKLMEDMTELSRSLGFSCEMVEKKSHCIYRGEKKESIYYRCHISGNADKIPTLIPRKKCSERKQKKRNYVYGFSVEKLNYDNFYGFSLDGNNRYLDSNFYVHHNSGKTCSSVATASVIEEDLNTILWVTRASLKQDMWKNVIKQSCHEVFKNMKDVPKDVSQRKRVFNKITKKKWIPPMSYNTFSNIVGGKRRNKIKDELLKRNGKEDILKKTFIIIDEAHNIFNPPDLSAQERANFDAIRSAIYNSYKVSGNDSCRVLLLTATPINDSPLQLCKLLNLLIGDESNRLPNTEKEFIDKYVDLKTHKLKSSAISDIRKKTQKIVSYVDRSEDKNYFTQKIFEPIITFNFNPNTNKTINDFLEESKNIKAIQTKLCDTQELISDISEISSMNVDIKIKIRLMDNKYDFLGEKFLMAVFDDVNIFLPFKNYREKMKEYSKYIKEDYEKQYQNQVKYLYEKYKRVGEINPKELKQERKKVLSFYENKMKKEIDIFTKNKLNNWKIVNETLKNYNKNCNKIIKNELLSKQKTYKNYLKTRYKIYFKNFNSIFACISKMEGKKKNVNDCKKHLLWMSHKTPMLMKFDNKNFEPQYIKDNVNKYSPFIMNFIKNIQKIDDRDMKKHGKLFKHVIYVDKKSYNGLKLVLSLLIGLGFNLCIGPKKSKRGKTLDILSPPKSKYNMLCLSSSKIFDTALSKSKKVEIFETFNKRPDNIHGEQYRFMLFDGGFKEGVDLFDVKYFHILQGPDFENQMIQVIGRATRFCGQVGLDFKKNIGWELKIYIYDMISNFDKNNKDKTQRANDFFLEKTYKMMTEDKQIMKKIELDLVSTIRDSATNRV